MRVEDLRNYGKPMTVIERSVPEEVQEEVQRLSFEIMAKHLGPDDLQRLQPTMAEEKERLLQVPLSVIRERGLDDDAFIAARVEQAALFAALSHIVGTEKAVEILYEITEVAAPKVVSHIWPTAEEFLSCDDPSGAFKEWTLSLYGAGRKIGVHEFELAEDTDDAFQLNVTYCAWHETLGQLGAGEACPASCHEGDVLLPGLCASIGLRYTKTSTLSKGAAVCDYRFERVRD